MRNLRAIFVLAFAACGGGSSDNPPDAPAPDSPPPPDAPPQPDAPPAVDLSCVGNSAPANGSAVDPIPVAGTLEDVDLIAQTLVPVDNAMVFAFKKAPPPPGQIGDTTSDANGAFTLSLASGTNPIDGFLEAAKAQHRTVRLYPPSPLTMGLDNVLLLLITQTTFDFFVGFAGATQDDTTNGTVAMIVVDCMNNPIDGAVPSVTQNGNAVGMVVDGSQFQPGLFFFFDVPPSSQANPITVGATFNGTTLRAHDIDVVAATTSTTAVRPGF